MIRMAEEEDQEPNDGASFILMGRFHQGQLEGQYQYGMQVCWKYLVTMVKKEKYHAYQKNAPGHLLIEQTNKSCSKFFLVKVF